MHHYISPNIRAIESRSPKRSRWANPHATITTQRRRPSYHRPREVRSRLGETSKTSQSRLVTRDSDIRRVLLADLSQLYSDKDHDLIVEEFGCNSAHIDIAVINGALHAFEIKSDSLDRLPSQIEAYQGVFEYITLVCGRRLMKRARVTIPKWWGLKKAGHKEGTETRLCQSGQNRQNGKPTAQIHSDCVVYGPIRIPARNSNAVVGLERMRGVCCRQDDALKVTSALLGMIPRVVFRCQLFCQQRQDHRLFRVASAPRTCAF